MEWVSYLAGEPHGDQPACVSPVLRAFCVALNDGLDDPARQRLRPYLARTIGTSGDGLDESRSWMAMDWLIRVYAPAWLRLAGLSETAHRLASLAPVLGLPALQSALDPLERARRAARSAWAAAAGTVRSVSWAPGRFGAHEIAWSSAGAAVWAAARVAVGDMAGDRARAAAGDAAAAARSARGRAEHVHGRTADRAALGPTLIELQARAVELLDRMLPKTPLGGLFGSEAEVFGAVPDRTAHTGAGAGAEAGAGLAIG